MGRKKKDKPKRREDSKWSSAFASFTWAHRFAQRSRPKAAHTEEAKALDSHLLERALFEVFGFWRFVSPASV
jgi:hypothetical protein